VISSLVDTTLPRLSLSPLAMDLLVALSQRSGGTRVADLARFVQAPATSVSGTLRDLAAHGVVRRNGMTYEIAIDHPAHRELLELSLRLPSPGFAIETVLRASDAIEFACVDPGGFIASERSAAPGSGAALEMAIETIRRDRPDAPHVLRFSTADLNRIAQSAMGLRARLQAGRVIKGRIRATR
jgi:hypothetical protein